MTKKRKLIKRVYENGRETTLSLVKKKKRVSARSDRRLARKKIKKPVVSKPEEAPAKIKKPFIDNYELPSNYGKTGLTFLVRDPFWLYAYWEIVRDDFEELKTKISNDNITSSKLILRVYDITLIDFNGNNANFFFDIEIGPFADSWHIDLHHDAGSYVGEVGLLASNGNFFALCRSNYVQTPRVTYSNRTEQIWMEVKDNRVMEPYAIVKTFEPGPDSQCRPENSLTLVKKKRFYITEEEIRRYYSNLSPLLREIIATRLSRFYGKKGRKHLLAIEGESNEDRYTVLSRLPKGYFLKKIIMGSSWDLAVLGQDAGGASEKNRT